MIKTIIFDMGGVIIDIDFNLTAHSFKKLGATRNLYDIFSKRHQTELFNEFEIGKIDSPTFRKNLKNQLHINHVSDNEFDDAWNSLFLTLPSERLHLIARLGEKYNTFLFSNTNEIHLKKILELCKQKIDINDFNSYFNKTYFSHKAGFRKPHTTSFETILIENNLHPQETLFIDDSIQHINGAKEAKIHTFHITEKRTLFDLPSHIALLNLFHQSL